MPTDTEAETEPPVADVTFTWSNPTLLTSKADNIDALRDPFILKVGDHGT